MGRARLCCPQPCFVAVWINGKYKQQCINCKAVVG